MSDQKAKPKAGVKRAGQRYEHIASGMVVEERMDEYGGCKYHVVKKGTLGDCNVNKLNVGDGLIYANPDRMAAHLKLGYYKRVSA